MRFFKFLTFFIYIFLSFCPVVFAAEISSGFAIDLENNKIAFNKQENLLLNPASTLKSVTSLIALKNLKSDFKFSTKLYVDKNNKNLYLQFDGNPFLEYSDLVGLFESIKKSEYQNISIIYDEDNNEHYANGVNLEDAKFCFLAPSSQISIHKNCEVFTVIESNSSYLANKASHSVKLIEAFSLLEDSSKEESYLELKYLGANQYKLIGKSTKSQLPKKLSVAIQDPKKFLLDSLNQIELELEISIKKREFANNLPSNLSLVSEYNSPELKDMLKHLMKKSDNHVTDAIFKVLTNSYSFKKSAKFVEREINSIDKSLEFKIVDGSGVSVHNLISTKSMVSILKYGFKNEKLCSDFASIFMSNNDDSAYLKSLSIDDVELLAKTGSLESTATLVGQVSKGSGKTVFAIFVNNSLGASTHIRKKNTNYLKDIVNSTYK